MKLLACPLGEDGECLPLPSPVLIRLNEETLEQGLTLSLINQIKFAISKNILSASDANYPQWVQALHAVNRKRVLLVDSVSTQQYVFQEPQSVTTNSVLEREVDNSFSGMINRRGEILQSLQDLDKVLLGSISGGN